jgi:hypothetical protein
MLPAQSLPIGAQEDIFHKSEGRCHGIISDSIVKENAMLTSFIVRTMKHGQEYELVKDMLVSKPNLEGVDSSNMNQ